MEIVEDLIGDVLVEIINSDRATLREAEDLKDMLMHKISEGHYKVVVDLSVCEFVDSTFLGVLVNTLKKLSQLNGDLKLVGFKPAVRSMFELTRLFRVFETFGDLQEAIKSFGNK